MNFGPRQPRDGVVDVASYLLPALEEQLGWVREAAGPRFADLELCTYNSWTVGTPVITDHGRREAEQQAAAVRARTRYPLTADELIEAPTPTLAQSIFWSTRSAACASGSASAAS